MPDRKKPPLLEQNGVDLETWLCKQIAPAGTVEGVYGGFKIVVIDESAFPWANVLRRLVQSRHGVWLEERKGKLVIMTQPSID